MIECRECRHNPATHMYDLCKDCYFTPTIAKKYREEAKVNEALFGKLATKPEAPAAPIVTPISADDFVGDGCYAKKITTFGAMDISKTNELAVVTVHHQLADSLFGTKETGRWSAANPPQSAMPTNKSVTIEEASRKFDCFQALVNKNYQYNTMTIRQRHRWDPHKYPRPLPESHQIIGKAKQIAADHITGKISQETLSAIYTDLSNNDWPLYSQLRMYVDCIKSCDIKQLKEVLECVILDGAQQRRIGTALAMSIYENQPVPKWAGFSSQLQAALPLLVTSFNTYLYGKAHDANTAHYDLAEESCHWSIREPWLIGGQVIPKSPLVDAAVKVAREEWPIRFFRVDFPLETKPGCAIINNPKLLEVPFE